jgi:hypothetical protein
MGNVLYLIENLTVFSMTFPHLLTYFKFFPKSIKFTDEGGKWMVLEKSLTRSDFV